MNNLHSLPATELDVIERQQAVLNESIMRAEALARSMACLDLRSQRGRERFT